MIVVRNLTKNYIFNGKKTCIFDNVNFCINSKESVALIGRNGAGKSTLLRMLAGVDYPDSGKIISNKSISWPIGSREGFHPLLSARQNIIFTGRIFSKNDSVFIKKKIDFVEKFADIGSYFDKPFKFYSAGMRARVAFGLSMAFDFDFYLIDEITAAGDQAFRRNSKLLLEQKMKNSNFIMVDHNLEGLRKYCSKALLIMNKTIYQFNNIDEAIDIHNKELLDKKG